MACTPCSPRLSLSANAGHACLNSRGLVTCQEGSPPVAIMLCYAVWLLGKDRELAALPLPLGGLGWASSSKRGAKSEGNLSHKMRLGLASRWCSPSWLHPHRRSLPPTNVRFQLLCSHSWQEVNPKARVPQGKECIPHVCWMA